MSSKDLLSSGPRAVCLGVPIFHTALQQQGVPAVAVDWRPPAGGRPALTLALERLASPEIDAANREAVQRVLDARPVLVGMARAGDVIPGMTRLTVLHAGPPITWERMSGPLRGAVLGALIFEGLAADAAEAEHLAAGGQVAFSPCHEHDAVGPMAGVTTASMPVFIVENQSHGNRAYCTINEGLGKVLRYGAYGPEVLERLRWLRDGLFPVLKAAIARSGGIDLKALIGQALHMGDEGHNRNRAGTSLFLRAILPHLIAVCGPGATGHAEPETLSQAVAFISGNDHFFLNLSMPACKASMDAAHGVAGATLITTLARNGTEFGIRVSGLPGRWFTGPAAPIRGLFFPGYGPADANPDIGDSAITETAGIGGFVMGNAPAIVQFIGGTPGDALAYTRSMYEITLAENPAYSLPALAFRGAPTGIDLRRVVETDLLPVINTGIAHREPGVGMVGAGIVQPPRECFEAALLAFAAEYA